MITSIAIQSITINDNTAYYLNEVQGLEAPPVRLSSFDLAGEHFGLYVSSFYGKRTFSISGWIVGTSFADFIAKRDALLAALNIVRGEQPITFTLANGRTLSIDAVAVNIDCRLRPGSITSGTFSISFQSSFPFLVSATETSQTVGLSSGGGGKVPPATMPMALNSDSGGKISVVNSGNGIYYPKARIYGPVTNPGIRNDTEGKEIDFAITLLAGEYLDIDFRRKTIIDTYGTNRYDTKSGDWWMIEPGTSVVEFLAGTYNALSLLEFKYRESFLGI